MRAKKNKSTSRKSSARAFIVFVVIIFLFLLLSDFRLLFPSKEKNSGNITAEPGEGQQQAVDVLNISYTSNNETSPNVIVLGGNNSDYVITLSGDDIAEINNSNMTTVSTTSSINNTINNTSQLQRASEVEFYFLLKGKSYFKHILREGEEKAYNLSGFIVVIQPIIITADKVKFRINNYTTSALTKDEWESFPDFEIFVSAIYYRR